MRAKQVHLLSPVDSTTTEAIEPGYCDVEGTRQIEADMPGMSLVQKKNRYLDSNTISYWLETTHRCAGKCLTILALLVFIPRADAREPQSDATPPTTKPAFTVPLGSSSQQVQEWIEKLGDPSYAVRQRARNELQRMGLQAFDALHEAQNHVDSEIALTARHLVSSLLVSWSNESDPQAVKDALDEYGAQSETERQNRLDRLADLPERQGLAALCRLARFETSLRLSREAALLVMRMPILPDQQANKRDAETINEVIGDNDRLAASWLRAYANDLITASYSADAWRELVAQLKVKFDEGTDPGINRSTVIEFVQVCATRATMMQHRDEALQLFVDYLDLIPPRTREVTDACSWAIDNELHSIVLELKRRHAELFNKHPILLYGAAEALLAEQQTDEAEKLANQAILVDPLPASDSEEAKKMAPKLLEEIAQRHREVARELESRGLFRWAEREYQHIVDRSSLESDIGAIARNHLVTLFVNLDRNEDCVRILEPLLKRVEADQQFARRVAPLRISISQLKVIDAHQRGLMAQKTKDDANARKFLSEALEMTPTNADILIAMYRTDGDEAWKKLVLGKIQQLAKLFETEIRNRQSQSKQLFRQLESNYLMAEYMNQYAWLISNTEGDYKKALEYSLQSIELSSSDPVQTAAQLDTAGRCYYALQQYDDAIRMQKRALKLEPHSPAMQRQLKLFEEAKANQPAKAL